MLYRGKMGSISLGSGIGFVVGSYLYQQTGILGGCLFVGGFGILHLILVIIYVDRLLATQSKVLDHIIVHQEEFEHCNNSQHVTVYKYFTPFLLSTGAVMITTQFSVSALYWEDVWNTKPVVIGLLLFIGEIAGFFVLIILKRKCVRNCTFYVKNENCGRWELRCTLFQQPVLIVLSAFLGLMSVFPLSFGPWALYADAAGTVLLNITNTMLHSSGLELMVLLLPNEMFQTALTRGYVAKRFVNAGFGILFAFLYEVSPHLPFQMVFGWLCFYILSMCIVFSVFR